MSLCGAALVEASVSREESGLREGAYQLCLEVKPERGWVVEIHGGLRSEGSKGLRACEQMQAVHSRSDVFFGPE